jgi:hypothetical protein
MTTNKKSSKEVTKPIERKEIKVQRYVIKVTSYDDKTSTIQRINEGFNPIELLGLCTFSSNEIIQQIKGNITPDVVIRQVVQDELKD